MCHYVLVALGFYRSPPIFASNLFSLTPTQTVNHNSFSILHIQTGETLYSAKQKCPNLYIAPPKYDLYMKASNAMFDLLSECTNKIQRYTIDENFIDVTDVNTHLSHFEHAEVMRTR